MNREYIYGRLAMISRLSLLLFILGLISNLTALYLVVTKSRKELVEYKKLLIIFLISDLVYTVLQDQINPIFVVHKDLFIVILPGLIQNKIFISIYCSCVSMSFVIFAFHFLYRAIAISSKSHFTVQLTSKRLFIICAIFLGESCIWAWITHNWLDYEPGYEISAREFYKLNDLSFPSNPYNSIVIFKGYRENGSIYVEKLLTVLLYMGIVAVEFIIIIASSIHITRTLVKRGKKSNTWKKFHKQLFTALLVQLAIPCVLLYFPCSFYLLSPFLNSDRIQTPIWLLSVLYSIYPILDPLAIILMISDYRQALLRVFKWISFQSEPISIAEVTTMTSRHHQHNRNNTNGVQLQPINII